MKRSARERGRYSKSKGKSFENRVAAKMSLLTRSKWLRVPASGGWKKVQGVSGDLFLEENPKQTPYHVECKSGRGWSFGDLLREKGLLFDWLVKAVNGNIYGKPILLFISSRRVLFVGMNKPLHGYRDWNCLLWKGWWFGALSSFLKGGELESGGFGWPPV